MNKPTARRELESRRRGKVSEARFKKVYSSRGDGGLRRHSAGEKLRERKS